MMCFENVSFIIHNEMMFVFFPSSYFCTRAYMPTPKIKVDESFTTWSHHPPVH